MVRREPIPPRVQVAPDAARTALPWVRRCGTRAIAVAEHRRRRGRTLSDVLRLFLELAAIPSPPGEERAVADRVLAELDEIGLDWHEDGAGATIGSSMVAKANDVFSNIIAASRPRSPKTTRFSTSRQKS